jgi:hypothetical protein
MYINFNVSVILVCPESNPYKTLRFPALHLRWIAGMTFIVVIPARPESDSQQNSPSPALRLRRITGTACGGLRE